MQYRSLGKTGFSVSSLCMGTMTFSREADEAESARIYQECREAGINFFDCANVYSQGAAERTLGRLIAGERDDLVITSKVGMDRGLSAGTIESCIDESLKNLATDRLDVYFCHRFDEKTPVEETLRALDHLVRKGKILSIGVSNWAAWQIGLALGRADRWGIAGIAVLQPMYSLAKRTDEIEILPLAQAENLGVISYSPLGGGLLTGKYLQDGDGSERRLAVSDLYARRYAEETNRDIARNLFEYAGRAGVSPVTLAVAWAGRHPGVTAPIIGARNLDQLRPALAAAAYEMSDEEYAYLSTLTPPVPPATDRSEDRHPPKDDPAGKPS